MYKGQRIGQAIEVEPVATNEAKLSEVAQAIFKLLKETPRDELPEDLRALVAKSSTANSFWGEDDFQGFVRHSFMPIERILELVQTDPARIIRMVSSWISVSSKQENQDEDDSNLIDDLKEAEQKFANVIGNIRGKANRYNEIVSSIQNGNMIDLAMDLAEEHIRSKTSEFDAKLKMIQGAISDVKSLKGSRVAQKVVKARDEVEAMSRDDFISDLVERVKGQVAFTTSQFKEIKLEEIGHITERVEGIVKGMMNPIESKIDDIQGIVNRSHHTQTRLSNSSILATNRAISAGAYRIPPAEMPSRQMNLRAEVGQTIQSQNDEASYPLPIENGDVAGVTKWNGGRGDANITFTNRLGGMKEEGWIRLDVRVKVMLTRVQARFGKQLRINSAYRSPAYNRSVGGATNSCHIKGLAVDVSFSGFSVAERERFIKIAKSEGFKGIGRYKSFVHVDIGSERNWEG